MIISSNAVLIQMTIGQHSLQKLVTKGPQLGTHGPKGGP